MCEKGSLGSFLRKRKRCLKSSFKRRRENKVEGGESERSIKWDERLITEDVLLSSKAANLSLDSCKLGSFWKHHPSQLNKYQLQYFGYLDRISGTRSFQVSVGLFSR